MTDERRAEHDPEMDEWMDAPMGPTDERLCGDCGGPSEADPHQRPYSDGHWFNPPPEAVPSTDEGEARGEPPWDREKGIPAVWRKRWLGYSETIEIPITLEAAIRAPLEERIRELEEARDRVRDALPEMLEMAGGGEFLTGLWAQRLLDSHNRAKAAEDENARLREALRDTLAVIEHANKGAFDNGVTDSTGSTDEGDVRAWDIANRARQLLAIPPSSTEGTKEVGG